MLGLTGAVGALMELLAEAALETGVGLAARAALGVGAAAGIVLIAKKIKNRAGKADTGESE